MDYNTLKTASKCLTSLGLLCCNAQAASVLLNGNFEAFSITSAGYNSAYNVLTNPNGYVDNFVDPGGVVRIYPQTVADMGWQTTAPEANKPIELWESGAYGKISSSGLGQFAELNAYTPAALFQDVTISTVGLVDYSFQHKGRNGSEELKVLITYLGADGILGGIDDEVKVDQNFTTGNTAWSTNSGNDVFESVAGGVYRFSFGAVTPLAAQGNFLDNVTFGVNAIPELSAALLGAFGMLALLRRRRA